MRRALLLLAVAAGVGAAVAPLYAAGAPLDGFVVGLAVWGFAPFALIALLGRWMSVAGLLLALLALIGVEWLAVAEFFGSSDGQAGLIFLFLPLWMVVGVLMASVLDALGRVLVRVVRRHRSA